MKRRWRDAYKRESGRDYRNYLGCCILVSVMISLMILVVILVAGLMVWIPGLLVVNAGVEWER